MEIKLVDSDHTLGYVVTEHGENSCIRYERLPLDGMMKWLDYYTDTTHIMSYARARQLSERGF